MWLSSRINDWFINIVRCYWVALCRCGASVPRTQVPLSPGTRILQNPLCCSHLLTRRGVLAARLVVYSKAALAVTIFAILFQSFQSLLMLLFSSFIWRRTERRCSFVHWLHSCRYSISSSRARKRFSESRVVISLIFCSNCTLRSEVLVRNFSSSNRASS